MPNDQPHVARRSVLRSVGVAAGVAALGGTAVATSNETTSSTDGEAPAVTWDQTYQNQEREYTIKSIYGVFQTDDRGYGVWGKGSPVTETGEEEEQFFLIRTNRVGEQQWITFADDERENCPQVPNDAVQTGDGGYALVGYGDQHDTGEGAIEGHVAEAAKVSPDGEIQWFRALDAFEDDETSDGAGSETGDDSAQFYEAAPGTSDDGFVAVGDFEGSGWFVAFEGDGSVRTERTYGDFWVRQVFEHDDGYLLFAVEAADPHDLRYAVYTDADGAVREAVPLDGVDHSRTPYNHVFAPGSDGGYAYTGRDDGQENMVLAKLSEDGGREWREEYNGPGSSHDWAKNLVATEDGGYALGGYMSEAYSTDPVPAVVKTDADGAEQWRKLLTDRDHEEVNDFVETADGGYALLVDWDTLIKLAPDAEAGSGPGTPNPGETTTPARTDSKTQTSTGTPTSTTGSGTETAVPTETGTDTEMPDSHTTAGKRAEPATGTPSGASTQTGTGAGTSPSTRTPSTSPGEDESARTRSNQGSGDQVTSSGQEGFTGLVTFVALSAYALVRRERS